ncbi:MAG TPA: type II toxin-antitoxin system VapC family toxin [Gracilimonas sp.]|uniref:type II toxin-antitoxin system VapC family toxin n=1 Tax=Gracilimonas sp. TaxID=1974203 RepID=UPI002D97A13B|nr:type II toxin-antitoxin system VapC family toxin [Gracilimonas sp.]
MAKVLVDTDILIDIFRGNIKLDTELKDHSLSISAVTFVELIQGENTSRKEISLINSYIKEFNFLHISEDISVLGVDLVKEYSPSHNLKLADALIAATAILHDLSLLTLNKKDFKYIPELDLL